MTGRTVAGVCWGVLAHLACLPLASASVLANYDFSGLPGDQLSTPASWAAAGLTATAIRRGPGVEAWAGAGLMNSRAWTTGEIEREFDYFEWTIVPASGVTLNIDQIAFGERRSATGIRWFALRSSLNGFASDAVAPVEIPDDAEFRNQVLNLGSAFDAVSSPVTFRLYGYLSEAFSGRWGITNHEEAGAFRISGTVSGLASEPTEKDGSGAQAPEPTAAIIWTLVVAISAGGHVFRRSRGLRWAKEGVCQTFQNSKKRQNR